MLQDFLRKGNKWSILLHRSVQNLTIRHIRLEALQALNCKFWMCEWILLTDSSFYWCNYCTYPFSMDCWQRKILTFLVCLHVFYIFEFTQFHQLLAANTVTMPKKYQPPLPQFSMFWDCHLKISPLYLKFKEKIGTLWVVSLQLLHSSLHLSSSLSRLLAWFQSGYTYWPENQPQLILQYPYLLSTFKVGSSFLWNVMTVINNCDMLYNNNNDMA